MSPASLTLPQHDQDNTMALVKSGSQIAKYAPVAAGIVYKGAKALVPYVPTVIDAAGNVISGLRREKKKKSKVNNTVVGARNGIAAPVAIIKRISGQAPRFRQVRGKVHVTHRELVTTVTNTVGTFRVNNNLNTPAGFYRVNPTNANLFTWLPTLASNFDSFRFTYVRFVYVPLCATTEVGRVALFWDKDSQDALPVDRAAVSSYGHSKEGPPWAETVLNVPVDNILRFTSDSNTTDRKLVDLGQLAYATYAGNSTLQIGDVYIEYGVEFVEPQPAGTLTQYITKVPGGTAVTTGPSYLSDANININATTANVEFFTPGTFLITAVIYGGTIASYSLAGGNGTLIGNGPAVGAAGTNVYTFVFSTTGVSTGTPTITQSGTLITRAQYTVTRVNASSAYQA